MIVFSKRSFLSTILILSLFLLPFSACRKRGPGYNPYLHKKINLKAQRENKKAVERGTKNYRKKQRKSRKHLFGTSKPAI